MSQLNANYLIVHHIHLVLQIVVILDQNLSKRKSNIIALSFIECFNRYAYLHRMTNHQIHLIHLVDSTVVVVQWAFVVGIEFVVESLEAFVEDMLQNERHEYCFS